MTGSPAPGDTIIALSSGNPPAAVAVIRTSGPRATDLLRMLTRRASPPPRQAVLRKLLAPDSGEIIDEALILYFPAPASVTGEDIVEYQCHGGRAVVSKLLAVLGSQDRTRLADPGEFTRRALTSGRIDLTEAEGLADLIEAETEAQRKAALQMAEGGLRRQAEQWRERLILLSARAEAAIDYVGDEDETGADEEALAAEAHALGDEIAAWLRRPRAEPLKQGIRVVVAGPPNAGKSSLVNALTGIERAIVTHVPGTTRDVIEVPLAIDGVPFVLIDTAGLRDSEDPVERIGIARADREMATADVLLWLGDLAEMPAHMHALHIHARIDEPDRATPPEGSLGVSSLTGEGMGALTTAILKESRRLLPNPDSVALNRRQADCLADAVAALSAAERDLPILAHSLQLARTAFDRLSGRYGMEDVLDALFSRFCLGK